MTASAAAALLNLLGYITGLSLYTMLLVMLLKGPRAASAVGAASDKADRLPLGAALLGLAWNLGALLDLGIHNFGGWRSSAFLGAAAFTALGFLPAGGGALGVRAGGRGGRAAEGGKPGGPFRG